MKEARFEAVCPVEIGDKVILVDGSRMAAGNIPQGRLFVFEGPKEHTITDIAAVHYVKSETKILNSSSRYMASVISLYSASIPFISFSL